MWIQLKADFMTLVRHDFTKITHNYGKGKSDFDQIDFLSTLAFSLTMNFLKEQICYEKWNKWEMENAPHFSDTPCIFISLPKNVMHDCWLLAIFRLRSMRRQFASYILRIQGSSMSISLGNWNNLRSQEAAKMHGQKTSHPYPSRLTAEKCNATLGDDVNYHFAHLFKWN